VSYSLTVLWCVLQGQYDRAAKLPTLPWYTHKAGVTFSDMLATYSTGVVGNAKDSVVRALAAPSCMNESLHVAARSR
jgi:hypothetical protein